MKTCHTCDCYEKRTEWGGLCHLNPPVVHLVTVMQPETRAPGGVVLAAAKQEIIPAGYFPPVLATNGCAQHAPAIEGGHRVVSQAPAGGPGIQH